MRLQVRAPAPSAEVERDRISRLVDDVLAEAGRELEPDLRTEMEARFQHDLRRVRIHTGPGADACARALGARAAALGEHLLFAADEYRPDTVEGRRLLAHELAHWIQSIREEVPTRPAAGPPPEAASQADDSPGDAGSSAEDPVSDREDSPAREETGAAEPAVRAAAAEVTSGRTVSAGTLLPAPAGPARIHCFPAALPAQQAAAALGDPLVEMLALDLARVLEGDPADPSGRVRRRVGRLSDAMRAAVVARVQEMLTPAQREQAAETLTAAALGEERRPYEPAPPPPPAAVPPEGPVPEEEKERKAEPEAEAEAAAAEREPPAEAEEPAEAVAPVPSEAELAERPVIAGGEPSAEPPEAEEAPSAEISPEAEAKARAAEPAGGERAASSAAAEAAPPGETAPGGAGVEPNLTPIIELETRAAEQQRQDEEFAREQPEVAPPGVAGPAVPSEEIPSEPVTGEVATPTEPALEAPERPPEREAEPIAETAGGPVPEREEPEAPPGPQPSVSETEAGEARTAEAAPTPQEIELAAAPEPPVTPELQAAVDEAAEARARAPLPQVPGGAVEVAPAGGVPGEAVEQPRPPGPVPTEAGAEPPAPGPEAAGDAAAPMEPAEGGAPGEAGGPGDQAGGDCGPDVGGGGRGGAAIEDQPAPATPDVSGANPDAAMGAIAGLPPAEMGQALAGVGSAATRSIASERDQLAARPPSMERPAGSPETRAAVSASATAAAAAAQSAPPAPAEEVPSAGEPPAPSSAPLPALPPSPTHGVAAPRVAGGAEGEVTAAGAQALQASLDSLPVADPALAIDAGPAPTVALEGDADPRRAHEQRAHVDESTRTTHEQGRADANRPLGENDIYPDVPPETLTADVPAGSPAPAPGPVEAPDRVTAIIAREEHSEQVHAAAGQAQGQMSADRQRHDQQVADGHAQAQQEMDDLVRSNTEEQATRRQEAQEQVAGEREQWLEAQDRAVRDSQNQANIESRRAVSEVEAERIRADRAAGQHIDRGNEQAATARRDAERDARAERDRGRQESRGVLGWLADRVQGFFDAIKREIQQIFEAARAGVRRAIQEAQRLANEVIDAARRHIVSLIREIGDALLAIADTLLAAFPELRDRFRAAIERLVNAAINLVNRLADALKEGIRRALNALGTLLEGYLRMLEQLYLATVNAVAGAVQGAIRAAQAVAQTIGAFAELVADVAPNPMGWLRNLGASAVDGLRNHVWGVIKCQIKAWFASKVEEILGLGPMIFDLLRRGGIRFAAVGRMVWEALKASLPGIAIQLAIEKVISLLVPAASALMLIIQGLRAAWGAMSRIIAAFDAFMRFLRAVKGGNAGRQFADALVAGAIALIDFLSNFLVVRLQGAAAGVSGRLRGLAHRIGARLGAVTRVAGRAAAAAVRRLRRVVQAARWIGGGIVRGVRTIGRRVARGVRAVGSRAAAGVLRVGSGASAALARRFPQVAAALRRMRAPWLNARRRIQQWRQRRRERSRALAERRLERAVGALRPRLRTIFERGFRGRSLRAALWGWRHWYRLRSLELRVDGAVVARNSPPVEVIRSYIPRGAELRRIVRQAVREFLRSSLVRQTVREMAFRQEEARLQGQPLGATRKRPLDVPPGSGFPALTILQRLDAMRVFHAFRVVRERLYRWLRIGRGVPFNERQAQPTLWLGDRNAYMTPPAGSGLRGSDYPEFGRLFRESGIPDQELAAGLRSVVTTGQTPARVSALASALQFLAGLMFGRESIRRPANLAYAAMTLELIERNQMTFTEAFEGHEPGSAAPRRGKRGAYPQSMAGAQKGGEEDIRREIGEQERAARGQAPSTRQPGWRVRELHAREEALADRWMREMEPDLIRRLHLDGYIGALTPDQARRYIAHYVRYIIIWRLQSMYPRISSPLPPATSGPTGAAA